MTDTKTLEERVRRLEANEYRIETTLRTLIAWLDRELGHDNTIRLLDKLAPTDTAQENE